MLLDLILVQIQIRYVVVPLYGSSKSDCAIVVDAVSSEIDDRHLTLAVD